MWTFLLSFCNLKVPDTLTQEKLGKVLDLFLPKMPQVNILYTNDDLEAFKKIDENINQIEDFVRTPEEDQFVSLIKTNYDYLIYTYILYLYIYLPSSYVEPNG